MKTKGLLLLSFFFSCKLFSQFGINPIIVNRIHSDEIPFVSIEYISWVHAIGGGLELYKNKFPFTFSITKDYYYDLGNFNPITQIRAKDINLRWVESFYMVNYRFNKSFVGAGYFNLIRESSLNLLSTAFAREFDGLAFSFTQSFKWLDIEYKTKVNLKYGFAAIFGTNSHSISFIYRISNYEKNRRNSNLSEFEKRNYVLINLGARFFNGSKIKVLQYETKYNICFKPAIGIEVINKPTGLGLFLEKDIWMTFNAGSQFRIVKDQIIGNSFGFRYLIESKKLNPLRVSLGLNFIRDSEVKREFHGEDISLHKKLFVNQMRGVLVGINYEILKNTDIEIRHTFPYISRNEQLFEVKRFSVGLNYRFDPLK